jgi:hypothetical protein
MPAFSSDSEGDGSDGGEDEVEGASPTVSEDIDQIQPKKHKSAAAGSGPLKAGTSKQQQDKKAGADISAAPAAPVVTAEARQAALQALKLKRARGLGAEAGPAVGGLSGARDSGEAGGAKSAAASKQPGSSGEEQQQQQQKVLRHPGAGNGGQAEVDGGADDDVGAVKKRRLVRAGAAAQVLTRPLGKENSAPVAAGDVDMGLEDF